MLNMLSISTAITMLVMATCSVVVDAAPTAAHAKSAAAATSATRVAGLEKIKHVVYFMQVSVLKALLHQPCMIKLSL